VPSFQKLRLPSKIVAVRRDALAQPPAASRTPAYGAPCLMQRRATLPEVRDRARGNAEILAQIGGGDVVARCSVHDY